MKSINEQIEKLELELQELKRIANKNESRRFIPMHGEPYWFLTTCGISSPLYQGSDSDKCIIKRQKVFRTEEEAIKADNQRIAIKKCNDQVLDIIESEYPDWVCDWSDRGQEKHYPILNAPADSISTSYSHSIKRQLTFEYGPKGVWERIDKYLIKQAFGVEC